MKTLGNAADRNLVMERLSRLTPDSRRQWGRMTPHQMICHLNDSFKSVIGERQLHGDKSNLLTRTVVRWLALYAPLKWPHWILTMPVNDQDQGGTPPEDFQRDLEALVLMIDRVTRSERDFQWRRHPLFAEMSERDWMRWGYLHADHHLRQFGV
jgi:hypothetical protein